MKTSKNILLVLALAAMTTTFAQENVNEQKETVITKASVTDDDGRTTTVKKQVIEESSAIAIGSQKDGQNFTTYMTPTDIDTSVSYTNNGKTYRFNQEDNGFGLMTISDDEASYKYATLRPLSQKGYYFFNADGVSSLSYYNDNGDFVVETYNPETDQIEVVTYMLNAKDREKMMKMKKAQKMMPK